METPAGRHALWKRSLTQAGLHAEHSMTKITHRYAPTHAHTCTPVNAHMYPRTDAHPCPHVHRYTPSPHMPTCMPTYTHPCTNAHPCPHRHGEEIRKWDQFRSCFSPWQAKKNRNLSPKLRVLDIKVFNNSRLSWRNSKNNIPVPELNPCGLFREMRRVAPREAGLCGPEGTQEHSQDAQEQSAHGASLQGSGRPRRRVGGSVLFTAALVLFANDVSSWKM